MTFTCDKQQLQDALVLVVRAVSSRTTMSILECVLLRADNESGVTLSANNLEISIDTAPISAEVDVPGSIALDAKLFTEIVRKMPGDFVTVETDENNTALVKSGRARLKIAGQPADEFPVMEESELVGATGAYTLSAPVLKDMIRQTIFSVSVDQSKLVLTGELMEINDNSLRMVAVDMFRISYRAETITQDGEANQDSRAVVPSKALNELSRILPSEKDENVSFYFTEKRAVFNSKGFNLTSRLLEGDFIRYDQIFNEDFATMVVAERAVLLNALERAVLVAMENQMIPITMDITNNDLKITAATERGQVDDGIPCETDGKDLTIYFNPRYFIEALRVIDDEQIVLKFNTSRSPCTIRGVNAEPDYKYLIVPLRGLV